MVNNRMSITIDYFDVIKHQAIQNIGTLGHVSEGKSTIVRAITGIKTQRHVKEKERNITINLGYANAKIYQMPDGTYVAQSSVSESPPLAKLVKHISFVDCPGHEAFMATMIGGTMVMDAACLVISQPQSQTQEHLIAATKVGLSNMIIIQNKCDLVTKEIAIENNKQICEFIKDTVAEGKTIIPISAQKGWNMQYVINQIMGFPMKSPISDTVLRMSIVRSFDVNKPGPVKELIGGVIGGTIQSGVVMPNDLIEIRPGHFYKRSDGNIGVKPLFTYVNSLRSETTELEYAIPGGLIGIGTTMDPAMTRANRLVGHIAGRPGTLPPITKQIKLKYRAFKRTGIETHKLKDGETVRISAGIFTVSAKVISHESKIYVFELELPACLENGQIIGILRKTIDKELLDAIGVIQDIIPYEYVDIPPVIDLEPVREVRWLNWPETPIISLPTFDVLINTMPFVSPKINKIKIPEPHLDFIPKHTVIGNYTAICDSLTKDIKTTYPIIDIHTILTDHFNKELCSTSSINKDGQLILAGRFKIPGVCNVLRTFMSQYKKCGQCGCFNTCLVRSEKVMKIYCGECDTLTYVGDA